MSCPGECSTGGVKAPKAESIDEDSAACDKYGSTARRALLVPRRVASSLFGCQKIVRDVACLRSRESSFLRVARHCRARRSLFLGRGMRRLHAFRKLGVAMSVASCGQRRP